jgi:hypothetical protein
MEEMNDIELADLLRAINKAKERRQGYPDASMELLLDFTRTLVERRTRENAARAND